MLTLLLLAVIIAIANADGNHWIAEVERSPMVAAKLFHEQALNATGVGSSITYSYSIGSHHFSGEGYDGSKISSSSCCSGAKGNCRNNPSCECEKNVGPLPEGHYTLGDMFTFHGMPYCYELFPDSSNNMCGRSGFLIHGGGCSGDPSEGCIVIEDENIRYKIKSGARLTVSH